MITTGSKKLKSYVDSVGGRLDAAANLGISYATICAWLYGHRKPDRYHREVLKKSAKISPHEWERYEAE